VKTIIMPPRNPLRFLIALFVAVTVSLFLAGCVKKASKPKEPPKEYILRGEVKRLDGKSQLATVDHEKIEGWMEAMTMEYPVKNPDDFSRLKVGSKIEAKVIVQDLDYWLADIKEMPAAPAPANTVPAGSKK
jgi:Cu/Ag efflux protein CusF